MYQIQYSNCSSLTRAGKTVLQLDPNDFYGGQYRTLSLCEMNSMFQNKSQQKSSTQANDIESTSPNDTDNKKAESEYVDDATRKSVTYQDAYQALQCEYKNSSEIPMDQYLTSRDARKFNIDLTSKLIYANVNLVPLLVKSSVGRYMEFKLIDSVQLYMSDQGSFHRVPCTKGEIMSNSFISRMDKLYLGKFLKFCIEYQQKNSEETIEAYKQKSFIEFLRKDHKLSTTLENFIIYAIAMLDSKDENVTAAEGMKRIERYMNSLGKYGNSAFLYPMYGISELSQAFCRVGAVYSGTFVLRRGIQSILCHNALSTQSESVVTGVMCTENQELTCDTLILNNDYRLTDEQPLLDTEHQSDMISRSVLLTNFMIVADDGAHIAILPPGTISDKQTTTITIVQLSQRSAVAPKDCFVISFQMRSRAGEHQHAQDIMKCAVQRFVYDKMEEMNENIRKQYEENSKEQEQEPGKEEESEQEPEQEQEKESEKEEEKEEKKQESSVESGEQAQEQHTTGNQKSTASPSLAKVIYDALYTQYIRDPSQNTLSKYANVFVCKDADVYLDMEDTVTDAKSIFHQLCGTEIDFIEKLPDPEESLTDQIIDEDARMLGIDQQSIQRQEIVEEESFSEPIMTESVTETMTSEEEKPID